MFALENIRVPCYLRNIVGNFDSRSLTLPNSGDFDHKILKMSKFPWVARTPPPPPSLSGENIDRCIISWVVNVFSIENLFSIYLEYFNLFSIYLEYLILILNPFYAFETTFTAESSTLEDLAFKTTIDISSWQKSWKYIRHAVKWLDPRFCSSSHSHFSPLVHAAFDLMASEINFRFLAKYWP